MYTKNTSRWIAGFFLAVLSCTSSAVTIVAPGDLAGAEGGSSNSFPFSFGTMRYQQVFDASHFGGISGVIDEIRFRVDGNDPSFSQTFDLEMRLSHTSVTPNTLSTTFANNIGGDETLVLDESSYNLSGTGGPGPNPFDVVFDINGLFTYDGVSNLLLDIKLFAGIASQLDATDRGTAVDGMQRVFGPIGDVNSPTGSMGGPEGLVTAFVIDASVPEPGTIALIGLGLAGIGYQQRRHLDRVAKRNPFQLDS